MEGMDGHFTSAYIYLLCIAPLVSFDNHARVQFGTVKRALWLCIQIPIRSLMGRRQMGEQGLAKALHKVSKKQEKCFIFVHKYCKSFWIHGLNGRTPRRSNLLLYSLDNQIWVLQFI